MLAILLAALSLAAVVLVAAVGLSYLNALDQTQRHIIMKLSELTGKLTEIETVLTKVKAEVEALKNSTRDVDLPADAQASIDRLSSLASTLDQLNDDTATQPTDGTPNQPAEFTSRASRNRNG